MKKKLLKLSAIMLLVAAGLPAHAQTSWLITGNTNITASKFLGTTNAQPLLFRTNNIERMRITNTGNVGIGVTTPLQKLDVNGNINIANGSGLYINNLRILHIKGSWNTGVGQSALNSNTTGTSNTAIGNEALYSNTGGHNNTAVGRVALHSNTNGYQNTANGFVALYSNTSGGDNTAVGYNCSASNTTGSSNSALGVDAFRNSISGNNNTAIGLSALYSNVTGNNNTALGNSADVNQGNLTNSTALGNGALITASNQVRIGNSSVTSIGGYVNWSNISDGRFKKNVKDNVKGLEFIIKLKPVSYNLDITGLNTFQRKNMKAADGKKYNVSEEDAQEIKAKEQIIYNGFVAQDVEKAAKETGYTFSGVDAPKNENDVYGLRYSDFVVPLVKAVQELSVENEELKSRLAKIEQMLAAKSSATVTLSAARLEQNAPNPFNQNTVINYFLPENIQNAELAITDANGRTIKTVSVTGKGNGQFVLEGNQLAAGTYQYSLIVNKKAVDTKRMVLLH